MKGCLEPTVMDPDTKSCQWIYSNAYIANQKDLGHALQANFVQFTQEEQNEANRLYRLTLHTRGAYVSGMTGFQLAKLEFKARKEKRAAQANRLLEQKARQAERPSSNY